MAIDNWQFFGLERGRLRAGNRVFFLSQKCSLFDSFSQRSFIRSIGINRVDVLEPNEDNKVKKL